MSLDGALALATDHFERHVAVPVDELAHRLQAEINRHRQLLYLRFDLSRSDALYERPPRLTLLPAGLIVADPALHRLPYPPPGHAQPQPRPPPGPPPLPVP